MLTWIKNWFGLGSDGERKRMEIDSPELALSESDIAKFEGDHHVRLPEQYRDHLLANNGGCPDRDTFYGEIEVTIAWFLSVRHGKNTIERAIEVARPHLPGHWVPFAYDAGGNHFCLDCRPGGPGQVGIMFYDGGDTEPRLLAPSFGAFIAGLDHEDEEF